MFLTKCVLASANICNILLLFHDLRTLMIQMGYMPERPLPKMAVETAANKKKPLNPPNSMIGQLTAVLGTAVLGTAFMG